MDPYILIKTILFLNIAVNISFEEADQKSEEWLNSAVVHKKGIFSAEFVEQNGKKYKVRDGENITLDCRVYLRQDKTVSWLRSQDGVIELLTVGEYTYSGDKRIKSAFRYPNNFRLNVTHVRKSDAGVYMCQISSHPPKELFRILEVDDALVEIVDPDGQYHYNQYYNPGSVVMLTCVVRSQRPWAAEVTWLKGNQTINFSDRPEISVGIQVDASQVISRLRIGDAKKSDSGNYSCITRESDGDNLERSEETFSLQTAVVHSKAKLRLHIMDGDFHAAVHGGSSSHTTLSKNSLRRLNGTPQKVLRLLLRQQNPTVEESLGLFLFSLIITYFSPSSFL